MTTTAPQLPKAEIVCEGASREEWLEARKLGLGGSDIAAVLGISPFKSPLALYLEKSGELEDDFKESEAMRWGTVLEQPIRSEFTQLTGIPTIVCPDITMYRSTECEIALASPDGLSLDPVGKYGSIGVNGWYEGKNVGAHRKEEWLDDDDKPKAPVQYEAQAMWELAVSGLPVCHLVALLGGQKLIHVEIERDENLIADMFASAELFWQRLADHNPPPADGSLSSSQALKRKFARSIEGSAIDLGPELANAVFELRQIKAEAKKVSDREAEIENRIKQMLGESEIGKNGDVELVTWKTSERKAFTVKAGTQRRLIIKKDAK